MASEKEKRERKLNEQGLDLYTQQVDKYVAKIHKTSHVLDSTLSFIQQNLDSDENTLFDMKKTILDQVRAFENASDVYVSFLQRTRTNESSIDEAAHKVLITAVQSKMTASISEMDNRLEQFKTKTVRTCLQGSVV